MELLSALHLRAVLTTRFCWAGCTGIFWYFFEWGGQWLGIEAFRNQMLQTWAMYKGATYSRGTILIGRVHVAFFMACIEMNTSYVQIFI